MMTPELRAELEERLRRLAGTDEARVIVWLADTVAALLTRRRP